ncbi:hypothetical protein LIER_10034 [Lithospermum erythrorhizon]|uniref:Zinc knuckle CX2CX4HX4C domain-containing protein n=1 Tax=Lithospermum erythrorhizon TaxID=34254 RepID=A0AAV3PI01_LITER
MKERGRYLRVKVKLNSYKLLKRGGLVPVRVNKVPVVYRYEKISDVYLYCDMLGHEHFSCDEKFDDEVKKVSRVNKYNG